MFKIIPVALFLIVYAGMVHAQSFSQKDFQALKALQGVWKMDTRRGPMYEEWTVVNVTTLVNRSFRITSNDTTLLEQVTLAFKKGAIYYTAVVQGQNNEQPVPFQLLSKQGVTYTFENAQHDYPQRVIYTLTSKNALHARIEGNRNGQAAGSDFYYQRLR